MKYEQRTTDPLKHRTGRKIRSIYSWGEVNYEKAKFHPTVNVIYWLALLLRKGAIKSPHLSGGNLQDKMDYEYNQKDSFFREVGIDPKILTGRNVIDIGCGYGGKAKYYAETFSPKLMFGIDSRIDSQMGFRNLLIERGNAAFIDWESDSFDIAMMEDVMEHVELPQKTLSEAYRILKPGGIFICKFPSIKSIVAHHFDRAIRLPGIHYLLSFKTLAEGLNHINEKRGLGFQPFYEVPVQYPLNLNGLDLDTFKRLTDFVGFKTLRCECLPYWHFRGEVMSKTIIYVGMK